jgi:hypothetical protein
MWAMCRVPEGITTDGKDGLYVSLFVLDQIWHVNPATGEKKKVADVPGGDLKGDLSESSGIPPMALSLPPASARRRSACSRPIILTVATPPTRQPVSTGSTHRLGR